jgi:hypothetical protein
LSPQGVVTVASAAGGVRTVRVIVVSDRPRPVLNLLRVLLPDDVAVAVRSVDDVLAELDDDAKVLLDRAGGADALDGARWLRDHGVRNGIVIVGTAEVDGLTDVTGLAPPFEMAALADALQTVGIELPGEPDVADGAVAAEGDPREAEPVGAPEPAEPEPVALQEQDLLEESGATPSVGEPRSRWEQPALVEEPASVESVGPKCAASADEPDLADPDTEAKSAAPPDKAEAVPPGDEPEQAEPTAPDVETEPVTPAVEAEPVPLAESERAALDVETEAVTPAAEAEPATPAAEAEPVTPAAKPEQVAPTAPDAVTEQAAPDVETAPDADEPTAPDVETEAVTPAAEAEPVPPAELDQAEPTAPDAEAEQAAPDVENEPVTPAAEAEPVTPVDEPERTTPTSPDAEAEQAATPVVEEAVADEDVAREPPALPDVAATVDSLGPLVAALDDPLGPPAEDDDAGETVLVIPEISATDATSADGRDVASAQTVDGGDERATVEPENDAEGEPLAAQHRAPRGRNELLARIRAAFRPRPSNGRAPPPEEVDVAVAEARSQHERIKDAARSAVAIEELLDELPELADEVGCAELVIMELEREIPADRVAVALRNRDGSFAVVAGRGLTAFQSSMLIAPTHPIVDALAERGGALRLEPGAGDHPLTLGLPVALSATVLVVTVGTHRTEALVLAGCEDVDAVGSLAALQRIADESAALLVLTAVVRRFRGAMPLGTDPAYHSWSR